MPLKMTPTARAVTFTWTSPKDSPVTMTAEWKIRPTMPEAEMLATLEKVAQFVRSQSGSEPPAIGWQEVTPAASPAAPPVAGPNAEPDPNAPRIQMLPPTTLSDLPNGGPPPQANVWSGMPTNYVPPELAQDWEMIPPGEA